MRRMNRKKLLDLAYKRSEKLHVGEPDYIECLKRFTVEALKEDIGNKGDITVSSVLRKNNIRKAKIVIKEIGMIAGIEEIMWFYSQNGVKTKQIKTDGSKVNKGDIVLELEGKEFDLLKLERTGLNLIQRMSGIATLTNQLIEQCTPLLIAATRKTHWGYLDNKAVSVGGGGTHRLGLWESILIKENHLKSLSKEGDFNVIRESLNRAWSNKDKAVFIEIEVNSPEKAVIAAEHFNLLISRDKITTPGIIMLDNFSVKQVVKLMDLLRKRALLNNILIEASGGITEKNVTKYGDVGVDVVSMGYLTHSPRALDLSQLII